MRFSQPLHMHKLKDDMMGDDKNNG